MKIKIGFVYFLLGLIFDVAFMFFPRPDQWVMFIFMCAFFILAVLEEGMWFEW